MFDEPFEVAAGLVVIDATRSTYEETIRDANDIRRDCNASDATVPVEIGVALYEIEAWMLADERSRIAAFGEEIGS